MLLQNIRAKIGARLNGDGSESGFTLIELLVVMLILGILAAIALPAFFNQKSKAVDAKAKENAHSAQVAMETCATENNTGSYAKCSAEGLKIIEPTLPAVKAVKGSESLAVSGTSTTGYTVTITSANGNTFGVTKAAGVTSFPCTVSKENGTNRGGCPSTGKWSE